MAKDKSQKTINCKNKSVLVISDLHFPWAHPDWYDWLVAQNKKYRFDVITNLGDELCHTAISYHEKDSSMPNPDKELEMALEEVQHLHEIFPEMSICSSNHGSLVFRKMKTAGIPLAHLRSMQEIYGTPGWSWHDEIILKTNLGDTLLVHGRSAARGKLAADEGMNAVQGHHHSLYEISWTKTSNGIRYNCIAGCLIDFNSYSFNYARNLSRKPVIGCMMIDKHGEPHLLRMKLNKRGRWNGTL